MAGDGRQDRRFPTLLTGVSALIVGIALWTSGGGLKNWTISLAQAQIGMYGIQATGGEFR